MYEILALGTQYYIYKKLKEAGINKFIQYIFVLWGLTWVILGFIASYDFVHPEYDIFSIHTAEILRAFALTWIIITIYGFFSFLVTFALPRRHVFAIILTIIITIYSMAEAYFVRAKHIEIKSDEITENLRIAFITDVHIGGLYTHWHFDRVMKIVNDSKPDILMLGGDIIDGDMKYREHELKLLTEAAKKARYGAFAVNGNHEHYLILDEDVEGIIRDCGYNLLINERVEAGGITIIGLDDMINGWLKPFIKPEDKNRFVLILKHRPGLPFDADEKNFDLQLSGHTHGGQFWPLGYFKNMTVPKDSRVLVSNGAGFNGAMMRLFTPPDVMIIDIVKE